MDYPILKLKKGKEGNVIFRHPWVFSGAIEYIPNNLPQGSLVYVQDSQENIIGTGTFSKYSSIAIRIFDFKKAEINEKWIAEKLRTALQKRKLLGYGKGTSTSGYRLVFGEADELPGLVVDVYATQIVIQISTAGMDALREDVVEALKKLLNPKAIVERSDMQVRQEEHLPEIKELLYGKVTGKNGAEFKENGLTFYADVLEGQKTGFFLDQKDLRLKIEELAKDKEVIDIFSYTGSAGIYALRGKAKKVSFVDSSRLALDFCEKHVKKNFKNAKFETIEEDAFQFTSTAKSDSYDMVLLDPPALIKSRASMENGKKAYHFLNRAGIRMVKDGGIFVTSSCSHFLSEDDFMFLLRRAEVQAGTTLHMLYSIKQSPDHPLSINFPESKYLKSFVFLVEKH
ncbi:MAG: class I SAM-dependent rRNA methyltransferase [Candidatus Gracilibacteria bacterium]